MGLSVALRGGAVVGTAITAVTNALKCGGPFGILGLAAISSSVIAPLTLYKQAYSFSVGYPFAMMSIGLALRKTFHAGGPASALLTALMVYGAKHLLLRECTIQSMKLKNFDQTNWRIPFSQGLVCASLATPALYLCRAGGALLENAISWTGVYTAWYGLTVEAMADLQKLLAKRDSKDFHGPSEGWFGVSRYPNYAGELVFWLGVLVAGLPSFFLGGITVGNSIAAFCSVLGFFGIYQTITKATRHLEDTQHEIYGGHAPFETWKAKTSALFPTQPLPLAGLVAPVVPLAVLGSIPWIFLPAPVIGVPLVYGLPTAEAVVCSLLLAGWLSIFGLGWVVLATSFWTRSSPKFGSAGGLLVAGWLWIMRVK